jgi:hypothetical protein
MHITRVFIDGFKRLTNFCLDLNPNLNVIVGDNETGKSSVLEAINLALSRQFDSRNIDYVLDSYLFNSVVVANYFTSVRRGITTPPPTITIEVYFNDDPDDSNLCKLKGANNTRCDNCPGVCLLIEPDNAFTNELKDYVADTSNPCLIPTEFYRISWLSFAGNPLNWRSIPFKATIIDTSLSRNTKGPNKYVSQVISDVLSNEQRNQLSLAYKKLRHSFIQEGGVATINAYLEEQGKRATNKKLSVQMDMSARASWDSTISAHLNDLPFDCVGKGEQCRVQMRLAIADASFSRLLLIEEPENHLSHTKMNMLMDDIVTQCTNQQIILTTHSAFVLNKLGIDNLKLISPACEVVSISGLAPDTRDYFMKLPGYDTLRLILATRCILVEGPSDELVVQRAYRDLHGKLPIEDGVDVISVSLAFKRFLEIASLLNLNVSVVTDNDGCVEALRSKYKEYSNDSKNNIRIYYDLDESCKTLEPQILKANSLEILNEIFGTKHVTDAELLEHMKNNKTSCALSLFETTHKWSVPGYIADAIK